MYTYTHVHTIHSCVESNCMYCNICMRVSVYACLFMPECVLRGARLLSLSLQDRGKQNKKVSQNLQEWSTRNKIQLPFQLNSRNCVFFSGRHEISSIGDRKARSTLPWLCIKPTVHQGKSSMLRQFNGAKHSPRTQDFGWPSAWKSRFPGGVKNQILDAQNFFMWRE